MVSERASLFRLIPVGKDHIAVVDEKDYEIVSAYKWKPRTSTRAMYAYTSGGTKRLDMHVLIMGSRPGFMVDHINRFGLDNRRENLRWATRSQNQMNIEKPRFRMGTSKFKGVEWVKTKNRWRARIRHNRVGIYIGSFINEVDAARAYDAAAIRLFGEFACINFPAAS